MNIHPEYAAKLATDYALQTDADLVETIYDCSSEECLTFLERDFTFDAFETMQESMVRLIVFGKFLAKNFREERVPPLNELRWHVVQQAIDAWTESTSYELAYRFNCRVRLPISWIEPHSYTGPIPAPMRHPSQVFKERKQHLTTPASRTPASRSQKPLSTAKNKRSQNVTKNDRSSKISKRLEKSQSSSYVTAQKSDGPIVKDQITSMSGTHPAQKCTQPLTDCSTCVLSEIVHRKDFKNEQVKDDDGIEIDDNVNSNSTNC